MAEEEKDINKEEKPKKKKTTRKRKSTKKKSSTKKAKSTAKKKKSDSIKSPEAISKFSIFSPPDKKKEVTKAPIIIFFAALIFLILAIGWYQSQVDSRKNQATVKNLQENIEGRVDFLSEKLQNISSELEGDSNNLVGYKEFSQGDLDIRFQYPETLGEASVDIEEVPSSESDEETNKLLTITFSNNPDIWLVAAQSEIENSIAVYNGNQENISELCEEPIEITQSGYCDVIKVGEVESVEEVRTIGDDQILNIVKTTYLNLENSEYSGITINVGLGLPPVTGRSLFAPTEEQAQEQALDNFFRNLIKKENLSSVVKQNLDDYQDILNSLTFTSL